MECVETITAAGRGKWGDHSVDFALSTVRRTWPARVGSETRSDETFRLSFQLKGYAADSRQFDTEAERDTFFNANVSRRSSDGNGEALLQGCTSWGKDLVGESLEAVTFVADYFQLQFHGGNTNFYAWPQVRIGNKRLGFGGPEYRDGLCSFIGQTVVGADVFVDDGVVLQFESGELVVSPEQIRNHEWPEVISSPDVWARMPPFN